jgi:hypothetical protein
MLNHIILNKNLNVKKTSGLMDMIMNIRKEIVSNGFADDIYKFLTELETNIYINKLLSIIFPRI